MATAGDGVDLDAAARAASVIQHPREGMISCSGAVHTRHDEHSALSLHVGLLVLVETQARAEGLSAPGSKVPRPDDLLGARTGSLGELRSEPGPRGWSCSGNPRHVTDPREDLRPGLRTTNVPMCRPGRRSFWMRHPSRKRWMAAEAEKGRAICGSHDPPSSRWRIRSRAASINTRRRVSRVPPESLTRRSEHDASDRGERDRSRCGHPQVAATNAHEAVALLKTRVRRRLARMAHHWEARRGAMPEAAPHEWRRSKGPPRRPDYCPRPEQQRRVVHHKDYEPARRSVSGPRRG
jgi:hypothetical protein